MKNRSPSGFVQFSLVINLTFLEKNNEAIPSIRKTGGYSLQVPGSFEEALRLAADQQKAIAQQKEQLQIQAPKVEAFDDLMEADGNALMSKAAKIIGILGPKQLCKFLRDNKILLSQKNMWNAPYQKYLDQGWFKVKIGSYKKKDGSKGASSTTLVTPKGIDKIRTLMLYSGLVMDNNLFLDLTE